MSDAGRIAKILSIVRSCCRYALAVVFLMAAITKITDLAAFEDQVHADVGLPHLLDRAVGIVLPWLELTCGAALLLNVAAREAALIVSFLLVCFVVYGLTRIHEPDCGCFLFPAQRSLGGWWPPVRDFLLLLWSVHLATGRRID
jgi:putative oxidoreductase